MQDKNDKYINNDNILEVYKDFLTLILLHPIAIISLYFLFGDAVFNSNFLNTQAHYVLSVLALLTLSHALLLLRFRNTDKYSSKVASWETYCAFLMFIFGLSYAAMLGYLAYISGPSLFMLLSLILTTMLTFVGCVMFTSQKSVLSFASPLIISLCVIFAISQTIEGYAYSAFIAFYFVGLIFFSRRFASINNERMDMREASNRFQEELTLKEAKLKGLVTTDKTTGLYTRQFFENNYAIEYKRAKRSSSPLSIMIVEIDCFEEFEELFGQAQARKMYISLSSLLKNRIKRAGELAAIFDSRTFVLLLPNVVASDAEKFGTIIQARFLDERIPHKVSKIPGLEFASVSIGVAEFSDETALSQDDLIKHARGSLQTAEMPVLVTDVKPSHWFTFGAGNS